MRDYRRLKAWELADDLTVAVYELTKGFPNREMYGLTSQVRRSASSVPANIAEGSGRNSDRDFLHFLYIARGSLTETQYFLHLATRLRYLTNAEAATIEAQARESFGCLQGLITKVEADVGRVGSFVPKLTGILIPGILSSVLT